MQKLNVNEIFTSINGEVNRWGQGSPTIFIRFQKCNLSCDYCDTKYACGHSNYDIYSIDQLLEKIKPYGIKRVTITGGEPLLQNSIFKLIDKLLYLKYQTSIETNGSIEIPINFIGWENLCWIVDYKEQYNNQMILENYLRLTKNDYIKFVISNKKRFDKALLVKKRLQKRSCVANFAFSPIGADHYLAAAITKWLVEEKIDDVILNIQIHKIIQVK